MEPSRLVVCARSWATATESRTGTPRGFECGFRSWEMGAASATASTPAARSAASVTRPATSPARELTEPFHGAISSEAGWFQSSRTASRATAPRSRALVTL
jgi:hypothetical protein